MMRALPVSLLLVVLSWWSWDQQLAPLVASYRAYRHALHSRVYVDGRYSEQRPIRYAGLVPLPSSRRDGLGDAVTGIDERETGGYEDPIGRYLGYALGVAMMLIGVVLICWAMLGLVGDFIDARLKRSPRRPIDMESHR